MSEVALDQQSLGEDEPTTPKRGRPRKAKVDQAMVDWKREFIMRRSVQQNPDTARDEADKAWNEFHGTENGEIILEFMRLNAGAAMGTGGLIRTARQVLRVLP